MNSAGDRSRDFEGDMQFLGKNSDIGRHSLLLKITG